MQLRHEISLCRVYVVSGSFRAFDRRPLGAEASETSCSQQQVHGNNGANTLLNSSQAAQTAAQTSSPESPKSEDYHLELPDANFAMVTEEEPLWEWDQLNCLQQAEINLPAAGTNHC